MPSLTPSSSQDSPSPSAGLPPSSSRTAGGCWQMMLGFFLMLAGGVAALYLANVWSAARVTHQWIPTSTTIASSFVVGERPTPNSPPSFSVEIRYPYTFEGKTYEGHRVKVVPLRTSSKDLAEQVVRKYPAGSTTTCYVNPQDPAESILQRSSLAAGYSIWFPLLFVVAGGVILIRTLFQTIARSGSSKAS